MTTQPIRLGIIGLGLIAQSVHLPNLRGPLREKFSVDRVCDISLALAEAVGIETGARWGNNIDDVLDDAGLDAVLLLTPGAHSAIARRALEKGKHVFAEKPYSYDPEIARRDGAFAAENNLVLQVGYMKMYEPAIAEARRRIGALGTLRLVRMTVLHPSDESQTEDIPIKRFTDVSAETLQRLTAENRSEVDLAIAGKDDIDPILFRNVLHGSVCHQTAVLRALFPQGVPEPVAATQDAPGSLRKEPPKMQIAGRIADGPDWVISWNWLTHFPVYQEWVEIYGDRGSLRIDLPPPYKKNDLAELTMLAGGDGGAVTSETWKPNGPNAFARELEAFSASVRHGAPVLSDADGAGRDAALLRDIAAMLGR